MAAKKNPIENFLCLFTEVRSGEGTPALLLGLNVFIIFTAYYIIKPVREALILAGGGAELKSYVSAGQVILLTILVPIYARLASRFDRRRLINVVTFFFAGCLVVFYLLAQLKASVGIPFYLWVGIFNVMIIAQFWAFANDLYTVEDGKRIFPIIAFGASFGAVAGSQITGILVEPLGVYQLLLLSGALLLCSLVLTNIVDTRDKSSATSSSKGEAEKPLAKGGAFGLVFKNSYLLMIALMILLLNWVNTNGEYILGSIVESAAKAAVDAGTVEGMKPYIVKFYSSFFGVVNVATLLIQLFLVSRILKYVGLRVAIMILPILALGGYFLMAFFPILSIVRWVKTGENSTDYSLQNTVRQVLFLPTTREQKYKAKQVIDTFFVRVGDVLSAALVFAGTSWLAFRTAHFAVFNLVLVAAWLALAVLVGREYKRLTTTQASTTE